MTEPCYLCDQLRKVYSSALSLDSPFRPFGYPELEALAIPASDMIRRKMSGC